MNIVVIMGRLTSDTELKTSQSGTAFLPFTIAVDREYSKEKQTDFINCIAFSKTAEFINKFFGKGKLIAIEGRLQTRKYEDNTGNKRTATEVIVNKAHFTGEKAAKAETAAKTEEIEIDSVDDLPF